MYYLTQERKNVLINLLITLIESGEKMNSNERMNETEIIKTLKQSMSTPSLWLLKTLYNEKNNTLIAKEILWEKTNELFLKEENNTDFKVISSRYVLDIHTARLEGAALIAYSQIGKVKIYKITDFGIYFLNRVATL